MLYEIFKFEINYRLRRPDTYLYFIILFFSSIFAVDFIFEGELGPLMKNAPFVIARTMGIASALFMMVPSMIMGVAILRDFDHQMESLIFVNPIKKRDYLLGRFLGSFVILVFVFSGLLWGMIVGNFMPWHDSDVMLPFNFWHYVQPFLFLVLPTLFYGGAIFFVTGALSRKLLVVYTQGFFFLMMYLLAMNLAKGTDDLFLTALFEPFTFQTVRISTGIWTVLERNSLMIPMEGVLLYNRLLWLGIGVLALVIGYFGFSFKVVKGTLSKKKINASSEFEDTSNPSLELGAIPFSTPDRGISSFIIQFFQHAIFSVKSIVKEVSFWAIVLCGTGILFLNSFNLATTYGVDNYPTTYIIVGELVELTFIFFLAIILFYSGELIWKERDIKINSLYDALPMSDWINLAGKFMGLMLVIVLLFFTMIGAGILFQVTKDYYEFELTVYLAGFFVEIFPFLFLLSMICFLFQVLVNHKFIAQLVIIITLALFTIGLQLMGIDHDLLTLGGSPITSYSDMNGYGHFLKPHLWFKVYWGAISLLLFLVSVLFSVRGTETGLKTRWKQVHFTKPLKRFGAIALLIFTLSGSYIFYNTNILNSYTSKKTQETYRAEYEQLLKPLQHLPQPKIVNVTLSLDMYPYERNYSLKGHYVLANKSDGPINEIYIQKFPTDEITLTSLSIKEGSIIDSTYNKFGFSTLILDHPIQPRDSVTLDFHQTYTSNGFAEQPNTYVVYNGTVIDNYHFPTIGYNEDIELQEEDIRAKYGLTPKVRTADIEDPNWLTDGKSNGDGEEINFEIVVSTDSSQTAVAPGYLQKTWLVGNRTYFHYKMDKQMSNFYPVVSARYKVMQEEWIPTSTNLEQPVDLEIYYHPGHEFNLDRMMNGMKRSLAYYSEHFSPYQYQVMKIVESPVYSERAQSFPSMVPFSEGIGFIMDITEDNAVDMPFYITAHEMAHQWWGDQINPAHVQGQTMISETLAQYSALMVFGKEYSQTKETQLLKWNLRQYLKHRSREDIQEMPLALVESGQEYVYYRKGLIAMNAFQHYVSEDSVNKALQRFITDWNSLDGLKKMNTENYPTTKNLMPYFRDVTPDSLQYLIEDLFETITIYDNKITQADYEQLSENQYKVVVTIDFNKSKTDSLGTDKPTDLNDWIELGIYTEVGNGEDSLINLEKYKIKEQQKVIELIVSQKPVKVVVDPHLLLIDKDINDNERLFTQNKPSN
tara:strand:- start:20644 stop:24279 length:3636 start_codon:yes stop_codon:yes gene_type:complete